MEDIDSEEKILNKISKVKQALIKILDLQKSIECFAGELKDINIYGVQTGHLLDLKKDIERRLPTLRNRLAELRGE